MKLRPYQQEAVRKMYRRRNQQGNELVVIATGGGKSVIIADFAHKLGKPVLILQPTKELLEQNMSKLQLYVDKSEIGIFSASMNKRVIKTFTFATIGSIYKMPELFKGFEVVLLDECDLLSPKDHQSMYMQFFKELGDPKVYGFTATPFRMDITYKREYGQTFAITATRLINRMKYRFWHRLIVNVSYNDLLDDGYLAPLEYYDHTLVQHSKIPRNSGSDFALEKYDRMISPHMGSVIDRIRLIKQKHSSVLIFCTTVAMAEDFASCISDSAVVTGDTKKSEREKIISGFRGGSIKCVFNVNVLTVGFDHPQLDCIVMIRPTRSLRLYTQMLGRGTRTCDGKDSCAIYDFAGNVEVFGRIHTLRLDRIDRKWELLSEKESWHMHELNRFRVK
jgi:DNA repair protein RadD